MAKKAFDEEMYKDFIASVPVEMRPFVVDIDKVLTEKGCKCEIKEAKSGYVTSYTRRASDLKLLNFVFRKTGVKIRIYAANSAKYEEFLATLPEGMKKEIIKSGDCKKLNGQTCSPYCTAGYEFRMDGNTYRKCRNMAFMPTLTDENNPYIMEFLDREVMYE